MVVSDANSDVRATSGVFLEIARYSRVKFVDNYDQAVEYLRARLAEETADPKPVTS